MDRFGRQVELLLGNEGQTGRRYRGLRIAFNVKMTSSAEPNTATITAYGIEVDAVATMQADDAVVRLNAGYDAPRQIFQGHPIDGGVKFERRGPESVLTIEAADGGREYQHGNVNVSWSTDVTARQVFDEVVDQLGLPVGYVEFTSDHVYTQGFVASGKARTVLDRLALAEGATWNIRDGAIYFYPRSGATGETAVVVSARAGNLIGAPVARDKKLEVRCLLEPSIRPGRHIQVESEQFRGLYVARDVVFAGDAGWSNDYYTDVVAEPA